MRPSNEGRYGHFRSCEEQNFRDSGMPETDPIVDICQAVIRGQNGESINENEKRRLVTAFKTYTNKHPEDKDAKLINSEDIKGIAKFLDEYMKSYHTSFANEIAANREKLKKVQ